MSINPSRKLSANLRECLANAGLASLMTVARLKGEPSERALTGIRAIRDHLLKVEKELDDLPSLQPEEMAKAITNCDPDPEWRERILRGMTLVAMFDGEPSALALNLLEQTAKAFQVEANPVNTYRNVMEGRMLATRFDLMRRSFVRDAVAATMKAGGLPMFAATLKALSGVRDETVLKRFESLKHYPDESFGKAYSEFLDRNNFNYPGDTGGIPIPVFRHDCCHVLGGYGTTAAEEGAVIGFQAGFEGLDPFDVLMFAMAEFELGIGVSPFIPGEFGKLDPERMFAGMEHGSCVNTDLIRDIDPWDYFEEPLETVRTKFNIVKRGREPEYPAA